MPQTLACLAFLALASSAHAYELKTTSSGSHVRWPTDRIDLELVEVERGTLPRSQVLEALGMAAATWSELPSVPALRVHDGARGRPGYDGVNGVYVLAHWPFADRRLAVTVSTYRDGDGALLDADILVNGEMAFELAEGHCRADRYDLALVLTHEIGHLLGLDESDVEGATMWPTTRMGEIERRELSPDDVEGALALYSVARTPNAPAAMRCAAGASRAGSHGLVAALAGLWLLNRRRHARS